MKRSTAVRHLVEMAEVATDRLSLRDGRLGWPLEEMWAAGEYLDSGDAMDHGTVVLLIDVPGRELPWMALHPVGEAVGAALRLGKRPLFWSYRSVADPAWSHEHRRVVRIWSSADGLSSSVIDALRSGTPSDLEVIEPPAEHLLRQLDFDLARSREHLRAVLDAYWDRDWRRRHQPPEDHLWRAASAVSEIHSAIEGLRS